jgi:phosphoenolpyruvate-protein kinase (PTS system EI component)
MRVRGTVVVPGVAHGALWAPSPREQTPEPGTMEEFVRVRERVASEAREAGSEMGAMYEALLLDPTWDNGVAEHLAAGATLDVAIETTAAQNARSLAEIDDPYLRSRAHDFEQLGAHLIRALHGAQDPPVETIVLASDVSALELQRWSSHVAGLVLIGISPLAHLAIVARGLGVPTIAVAQAPEIPWAGSLALLEATDGWLETNPDPELVRAHPSERISAEPDPGEVWVAGKRIAVYANVNLPDDAPFAAAIGADGAGLVRTEFLYLGDAIPKPDREREAYARIAYALRGRPIVVRALDLGGDKMSAILREPGEEYGMLGIRGIRLLLRRPELFLRHVRAVLEGFADADLRIMFPMVASPREFVRARDVVRAASEALGLRIPPLGIMFEIPSAAFGFDAFAGAGASFISIGTNDLQQYFFASDRMAAGGWAFEDEDRGPAFTRFLADAIARAKASGLDVGVCGEAAGDPALTQWWLDCNVDSLSVTPGLVPWLKARIRGESERQAARNVRRF